MYALKDLKAFSTFTLILLLLGSVIFGAFIAYLWVMANFYLEPENTVYLVITDANFPVDHADYFNLTIVNPSHSPSGVNITGIYITVEGDDKIYNVTDTYPEELPIWIERGTIKTIKCLRNWGEFAGKLVTVHLSALNTSGATQTVRTKFVKLELELDFNASDSCKQFKMTVRNDPQSVINLTLTKIYVNGKTLENITVLPEDENVTLPLNVSIGSSVSFRCVYDWKNLVNPKVLVETLEGYYAEKTANATAKALLSISEVTFNETKSDEISVTIANSEFSSTFVDITDIILTYDNGTKYIVNGSLTSPLGQLPYRLATNKTATFHCVWNWKNYRSRSVTITAQTKQGFTSVSVTVKTPQSAVFKITDLNFNLTNTGYFLVNVTNMACSLQDINVTRIMFNGNETVFASQIILIGGERQFNCTFNWENFRGKNVTITVYTKDGLNVSKIVTLPSVKLEIDLLTFDESIGIPYVNITVSNSVFSVRNVKITQIIFTAGNKTCIIDGTLTNPKVAPDGYLLTRGSNVTIVCPWNWKPYVGESLAVIVQTAEGFQASETFKVESPSP